MSGEVEIVDVPQPTRPKVIARSSCDQRVRLATCVDSSEAVPWLLRRSMSTKGILVSVADKLQYFVRAFDVRSNLSLAAGFNGPIEVAAVAAVKCFSWPLQFVRTYEVPAPREPVKFHESKAECLPHECQHFSLFD